MNILLQEYELLKWAPKHKMAIFLKTAVTILIKW
jgi:hypothetical protein